MSHRCAVTGRLKPSDPLRSVVIEKPLDLDGMKVTSIDEVPGWLDVEGTVEADDQAMALILGNRRLSALPHAMTLATGTPYDVEIGTVRQLDGFRTTLQVTSRVDAQIKSEVPVGEERARLLQQLVIALVPVIADPGVQIVLSDIRLAAQDGSKFALVHLYRALDFLTETLGGERNLLVALHTPGSSYRYVKRLRSEREYRVSHSGTAGEVALSKEEIDKAFNITVSIFLAYMRHIVAESARA